MVEVIVEQPYRLALIFGPDEALGATDVLVRVSRTGICGQQARGQLAFDA
ncbi:hypothetical protein [Acidisoma sp. L85]|jgi:hypothetical protein|nr:hypothetical protein [Acidisoma sp. L85]